MSCILCFDGKFLSKFCFNEALDVGDVNGYKE